MVGEEYQNINFAIKATTAQNFFGKNAINFELGENTKRIEMEDVVEAGKKFTVKVICYNQYIMSSNQKVQVISTPITMSRALKIYGVSSDEELKKLFDNLYLNSQRGFLSRIFTQLLLFLGLKKL